MMRALPSCPFNRGETGAELLFHNSIIDRATTPSLFLRFVLILQCYVLENMTALISKKRPYQ